MGEQFTWGNGIAIFALIVTGMATYFGWQRLVTVKFVELDRTIDRRLTELSRGFDGKFTELALQINTIMMRDVQGLQARITALEADSADNHKRCSELRQVINDAALRIDRLERPSGRRYTDNP